MCPLFRQPREDAQRVVVQQIGTHVVAEVEFGDHQRYTLLWALSAALVMLVATIVLGVIPIVGHIR